MAISAADLKIYYTGAGSNSTPSLSIGGDISSVEVLSQSVTGLTTLTGVTINQGIGNSEGTGTLTYTQSTGSLTWTPPSGSIGTAVVVSTSGTYLIQGGSNGGALSVTTVAASLPTSNVSNTLTVTNLEEKIFSHTTKAESLAGVTKYHCFAIKNTHSTDSMVAIKLWVAENTPGEDTCALYLDPLAAGDGSTTSPTAVANENTAPAASTFVTPDSATHADVLSVGTLTAGQVRFFWIRQLVPANVTTAYPDNTFKLGLAVSA